MPEETSADDAVEEVFEPIPLAAAARPRRIKRQNLAESLSEQVVATFEEETYQFLQRRFETLAVKFNEIRKTNFNPFLLLITAPVYNIFSPFEVAERLQLAKAFHGDDTAFGKMAEAKFLTALGASIPPEKRKSSSKLRAKMTSTERQAEDERLKRWSPIDLEVTVDGKRCLLSIKAGPWTMNQAHYAEMSQYFPGLREETGANIVLGITYGRYRSLNNKPELVDSRLGRPDWYDFLVGKDLWEFVSGVADVHRDLFSAIRKAQRRFAADHSDETFNERLVANRLKIASSLRKQFSVKDDDDFWGTLFNSMFESEAGLPGHPDTVPPIVPDGSIPILDD